MTKHQRAKLVSKVFTFIVIFSLSLYFMPYIVVLVAIYLAVEAAKRT